jgi:hypothetical protein
MGKCKNEYKITWIRVKVNLLQLPLSRLKNDLTTKSGGSKHYFSALIVSALCLLIPAFYNGYPLVNPDVATYLASGFKPETPFDRPITYGLFTRLFSINGASLWLVVYAQALFITSLLFRVMRRLLGGDYHIFKGVLTVILLSLFSSLSWVVSQVQPDVFTPIAFMCIILLLMDQESRITKIALYVLFFLSAAMQLAHPLLLTGAALLLLVLRRLYTYRAEQSYKLVIVTVIGLSLASLFLMGSAFSKSRHIYFMGSLLEKGVLKPYLDDKCPSAGYRICAYKDQLGTSSDHFILDRDSPLYKIGDWKSTKPEFNAIGTDVLSTPKYLGRFLYATLREALQQVATFYIGDGNKSFPVGSFVERSVNEYFPIGIPMFHNCRQNHANMKEAFAFPNKVFNIVVLASVAILAIVLLSWKRQSQEMKVILVVCVLAVLLNSLDCATFSVVNGRYGAKMIWLLPFCMLCFASARPSSD